MLKYECTENIRTEIMAVLYTKDVKEEEKEIGVMRKTKNNSLNETSLCISREKLAEMLNVGLATADRISREAGARIRIGKRVIIKIDKVNAYLEEIAE